MRRFITLAALAAFVFGIAPARALPPLLPRYVIAAQEPGATTNPKRWIPGDLRLSSRTVAGQPVGAMACPHIGTALGLIDEIEEPPAAREVVRARSCGQMDYVDITIRADRTGIEPFTVFNADTVNHRLVQYSSSCPTCQPKFYTRANDSEPPPIGNAPPGDFTGVYFAADNDGELLVNGSVSGTLYSFLCQIHTYMTGTLRVFRE